MYITVEDCKVRYPIIGTWGKSDAEINSDMVHYAEVELNGRLGVAFTVPFSDTHPTIKDLAIDMTYYKIIRYKDPDKAEKIRKDYIGRIDDLVAGKERIYTDSGTVIAPSLPGTEIWSSTEDWHPVHSILDPVNEYVGVDSDWLDHEESIRE